MSARARLWPALVACGLGLGAPARALEPAAPRTPPGLDAGAVEATLAGAEVPGLGPAAPDGGVSGGTPSDPGATEDGAPAAGADAEGAPAPDGGEPAAALEVEAFEAAPAAPAVEEFAAAPAGPEGRAFARLAAELGVDTRFESPRKVALAENVFEARLRASLGLDVKLLERLRVVLEGRALFRAAAQRDFDRAKGVFEPLLGDAYVDLYTGPVDVRLGNQRIALGANAVMAPADVLNPRDLRESFLRAEPEDATLPVFALRLKGTLGRVEWLFAYAPFFTPSRYALFGQDEALMQPALAPAFETDRVDPTIEDALQSRLLETEAPAPFAGDVALHAAVPGRVKVGFTWAWVNEKLPRVVLDPELKALLDDRGAGRPLDPALATSVQSRFEAGETLYRGSYLRQHVFSLEGSTLLGPVQVDADVAYSPRVTFVDPDFRPLSKPQLSWVLTASRGDSDWFNFSLTYLGLCVFDVAAQEQLVLLEPATAVGAARVAWLHLLVGGASVPLWEKRFLLELRAAFEVVQRSLALAPRVVFQGVDGLEVFLAAEFFEGSPWSPFGYFSRNDKVVLGATWRPF